MFRYIVVYLALLGTLFAVETAPSAQRWTVSFWTEVLAHASAAVMQFGDQRVVAEGAVIKNTDTGYSVAIWAGCNGVEASMVLIAAILSYPSTWISKLIGVVVGVLGIQGLNLCRIVSLFYLGQWSNTAFEAAHLYFWPCLIILDALVILLLWMRWERRRRPAVLRL